MWTCGNCEVNGQMNGQMNGQVNGQIVTDGEEAAVEHGQFDGVGDGGEGGAGRSEIHVRFLGLAAQRRRGGRRRRPGRRQGAVLAARGVVLALRAAVPVLGGQLVDGVHHQVMGVVLHGP